MNKLAPLSIFFCLIVCLISCDETTPAEHIKAIKTVSERVDDLNKSSSQIKDFEDKDALSREDNQLLEYEYPIRKDESYVVTYRFHDDVCFEIGIATYFNAEKDAQKVKKTIIKDLEGNPNFDEPAIENDFYKWCNSTNSITIELDYRNIERGTIVLSIFSNR